MNKTLILNELRSYKKMNKREFAAYLGISPQVLNDWLNRDTYKVDVLVKAFPEVRSQFLLTGDGEMLKAAPTNKKIDIDADTDTKPVVPLNLYSESNVNVCDYISHNAASVDYSPTVRNIARYDLVFRVVSDDLAPHIKPGDNLGLKRMRHGATILNGKCYVLDTIDNGMVLRLLYDEPDEPDYYICKAFNTRYTDVKIAKKDVFDVYKVIGLLRASII